MNNRLQSDYERVFLRSLELADEACYEEALASLAEFYAAHKEEDTTGELRNAVLSDSASLLDQKGDHEAAVRIYRETDWSPDNTSPYLNTAHALAKLLVALRRQSEAAQVLQTSLDAAQGGHLESYLPLLRLNCEIAGNTGIPIRYQNLVGRMAEYWGVPTSEDELNNPVALVRLVIDIDSRFQQARPE